MAGAVTPFDPAVAGTLVDGAIADYAAACHGRVTGFVDRHFSLRGSLALHRRALGWDLARAPANLLLSVPQLGLRLAGGGLARAGARRAGARIAGLDLLYRTDVARKLGEAIERELLQLGEVAGADGVAASIAADPRVSAAFAMLDAARARSLGDADFRAKLEGAIARYAATRVAAAEIATALTSLGIGAIAFKQVTPGLLSLGPVLAGAIAQQAAIGAFPLGATLGGIWNGVFPATAGPALVAGVTGSLFVGAAALSAFAGVVVDPAQRALGLHQRRLHKLINGVEHALRTGEGLAFNPRDHYVARATDLIDLARLAQQVMAGGG
ncbi:DUF6635 family protein [Zavarzinia aquatilis]|uniref:Uncharacterized protein n=1 Tax=Zavarzinia aquatilis TaxID=2211142 RepID=A0A317EB30_9PROT|nr:DUF6635 family protein [Zavarzinia aquatilis]PWR22503.1 hypothetical protein DKG74_11530 [Zavarzinia aquatilis]